jgi:hypothetical protein
MVATPLAGAKFASNQKLYSVPQRIAFALGSVVYGVVENVTDPVFVVTVHAALLKGAPECDRGAWKPAFVIRAFAGAGTEKLPALRSAFRFCTAYS